MIGNPAHDIIRLGLSMAISAMQEQARGREVYTWLSTNYAEMAPALSARPSWSGLAGYLGANGVLGTDGNAPTAASVRAIWQRVSRQQAKRKG